MDQTDAAKANLAKQGSLFAGMFAAAWWLVLFLRAMWEPESVAAGAVIGWLGLTVAGISLGASLPTIPLASRLTSWAVSAHDSPGERLQAMLVAVGLLGISAGFVFLASERRWDHLPTLLLGLLAVVSGYMLARAWAAQPDGLDRAHKPPQKSAR